jgi:ATP-dependent RNA helicase DDX55/SPB4
MDKYKYQDKQKEAVRVKKLAEYKAKLEQKEKEGALNGGNDKKRKPINKASAWSEKQEAKERKMDRQLKKQRKRDYLKRLANGEIKAGEGKDAEEDDDDDEEDEKKESKDKKMADLEDDVDDEHTWEDLAREERLAKKVKKGKLSSKDFDKEVGNMFADL